MCGLSNIYHLCTPKIVSKNWAPNEWAKINNKKGRTSRHSNEKWVPEIRLGALRECGYVRRPVASVTKWIVYSIWCIHQNLMCRMWCSTAHGMKSGLGGGGRGCWGEKMKRAFPFYQKLKCIYCVPSVLCQSCTVVVVYGMPFVILIRHGVFYTYLSSVYGV